MSVFWYVEKPKEAATMIMGKPYTFSLTSSCHWHHRIDKIMVSTQASIDTITSDLSDTMEVSLTKSIGIKKKGWKVNSEGYDNIILCLLMFLITFKFI